MGGAERVARQHAAGKLTVRERIERLLDPGTFHETGALAGRGEYDERRRARPASCRPTCVVGQGRIDGRRAVVQADDFTVRGGAADAAIWQKMVWAERAAHELRVPLVRLVDGTGGGGSVKTLETMGFSYVPPLPGFELVVENLSRVPVVAAALGPVRGARRRARRRLSHFSVIVRGSAQLFVAGPAGRGRGDGRVARQGGARRRPRADARRRGRQRGRRRGRRARSAAALPVLPAGQRVGGAADRWRRSDPAERREEELLAIVPRERRQTYDMRRDPRARARRAARSSRSARASGARSITALARLDGRPVGVLASDPNHYARRADRRRLGQARALRRRLRRLPPAGRQLRRPARAS